MQTTTRDEIFALAAKRLRTDFIELSSVPHSGLKGDAAAKLLRTFLDQHLPQRFRTGSGFILDRKDSVSKQIDVLIYDAMNCPVYRASEEAGIFPADNVAAVIEVKARLDKEKLSQGWDNIAAAKGLAKTKPPNVPYLVQTQTLGMIFSFDTPLSGDTIEGHYRDLLKRDGLGHHVDIVAVHDRFLLRLACKPRGFPEWAPVIMEGLGGPAAEGTHLATSLDDYGEASLDAFFRVLLAHLSYFRAMVDHPGFGIAGQPLSRMQYLTSITFETDRQRRQEILKRYSEEVERDFAARPVPEGFRP